VDTDRDGIPDTWEIAHGIQPTNPDSDDDGLGDALDAVLVAARSRDADHDGVLDGAELAYEMSPTQEDSDADGVLDGDELRAGSNPNRRDSDGDAWFDVVEIEAGWSPSVVGPGRPPPGPDEPVGWVALVETYDWSTLEVTGLATSSLVDLGECADAPGRRLVGSDLAQSAVYFAETDGPLDRPEVSIWWNDYGYWRRGGTWQTAADGWTANVTLRFDALRNSVILRQLSPLPPADPAPPSGPHDACGDPLVGSWQTPYGGLVIRQDTEGDLVVLFVSLYGGVPDFRVRCRDAIQTGTSPQWDTNAAPWSLMSTGHAGRRLWCDDPDRPRVDEDEQGSVSGWALDLYGMKPERFGGMLCDWHESHGDLQPYESFCATDLRFDATLVR
jgi:hypothetical protein